MNEKNKTVSSCQKHPTTSTSKKMFVEKELAWELRVSVGVLRKWRSLGMGPAFCKMGGCIRYPADGIQQFIEESKCQFTGQAQK